MSKGPRTKKTW